MHTDGPCLVLAGPGSGKTHTITGRIAYLLKQNIPANQILVITFTKAAASEMKARFLAQTNGDGKMVTFGTFHAVFFTILKYAYRYTADNIIREEYKYQFLRDIINHSRIYYDDEKELLNNLLQEISVVKNNQIALEHYYATSCGAEVFRRIYTAYDQKLKQNRFIDFDDMLLYTKELLEQRQDIREFWQNRYRYILVDEAQDMNYLQYEITKLLAAPQNNLFLVGDDDQSIYRFRGARPELLQQFVSDYANAKTMLLKENYRSCSKIVDLSMKLISHSNKRFAKEIEAVKKETGVISYQVSEHVTEQNQAMINQMKEMAKNGRSYDQMAVLFRTNRGSGYFLERLMNAQIPFYTKEHVPIIYDHWIAKDIMAYLRLGAGSRARSDFLQIMNRPLRYLSRDVLNEPEVAFDVWESYYKEQPWMLERIGQLAHDLQVISSLSPFSAISYIRRVVGYEDYVVDFATEHNIKEAELIEVLDELQESATGYRTLDEWETHIMQYRERMKEEETIRKEKKSGVAILTMHGAKGLEYDTVFIPDLVDGNIPYKKSVLDEEIEEERRLLYVAITRAKEQLYLYRIKKQNQKELAPSRFLVEAGFE